MAHDDADAPFWAVKGLSEMTEREWESLCDGCGRCCLVKLEDEETEEIAYTDVACRLFDAGTCRCRDYDNRQSEVPDCVRLTPQVVEGLSWLPGTCAYRRVAEGKGLAWLAPVGVRLASDGARGGDLGARAGVGAGDGRVAAGADGAGGGVALGGVEGRAASSSHSPQAVDDGARASLDRCARRASSTGARVDGPSASAHRSGRGRERDRREPPRRTDRMNVRDLFYLVALGAIVGAILLVGRAVLIPVVAAIMLTYVIVGRGRRAGARARRGACAVVVPLPRRGRVLHRRPGPARAPDRGEPARAHPGPAGLRSEPARDPGPGRRPVRRHRNRRLGGAARASPSTGSTPAARRCGSSIRSRTPAPTWS